MLLNKTAQGMCSRSFPEARSVWYAMADVIGRHVLTNLLEVSKNFLATQDIYRHHECFGYLD